MNRHLSRLITMQTIYEWCFRAGSDLNEITERNIEEYKNDADAIFIRSLVSGIAADISNLDEKIKQSAPEWPLEQISLIDKSILRLAVYELTYLQETPPKVVINEAVELSKQFGGDNSSKFVNGVLGTIFEQNNT